MSSFGTRIVQSIRLDPLIFEEVEADKSALGQALGVVVLSSLASGIASVSRGIPSSIIGTTVGALIGWFIWSYLIYIIGAKWLPQPQTRSDYGELLRTIGFASAPGIIAIVGIIPGLFTIASIVASIWMLVATVIAVRQALDYNSTGRAIVVCVIGWIIYAIILWLMHAIF
ncbi:MAG: YIP1 family protein [Calditrichia bacterium]